MRGMRSSSAAPRSENPPPMNCLGPRLLSVAAVLACPAVADEAPTREHLAPPGFERSYHEYHYSPVVRVGNMVIVSGIPAGSGSTYEEKVRRMFESLDAHLKAAGTSLADVVELTSFHADVTDSASFSREFARFAPIHKEYFPDHYPAWSAVGTTALLQPGAPVELRAVAMIGSGRKPRVAIPLPTRVQEVRP
jgi:enamine deaminase RidA (YjgF/YER057c/UK114 family)